MVSSYVSRDPWLLYMLDFHQLTCLLSGEYHKLQCRSANCIPCQNRFGTCRGRENGIYPFHTERWTPTFVTCYQQRNIAQDDCQPPTPIFSPEALDCVSLFDVPKTRGGLRPECSLREDGIYPDEQGRQVEQVLKLVLN